jgi:hypothetical protein
MRVICWLALPVLLGSISYLVMTGQLYEVWSSIFKLDRVIDYPPTIELGKHELGDQVVKHFTIANRGGGELVIDQIRTNCSCFGLEREQDGRYLRMESVRLPAGEQADLVVRVSVRGVPIGYALHNEVEFRTNDPTHPVGRIDVVASRVSGGVSTVPPSVVFGTVAVRLGHRKDCRDDQLWRPLLLHD